MKKLLSAFIFPLTFFSTHVDAHILPALSVSQPDKVILALPSIPTGVAASPTVICSGESITLSATCPTGTVTWYNQQTGGTVLGTGTGLSQNPIVNTIYYASCVDGIDESERIATNQVKVNTPIISSMINPQSFGAIIAFEGIDVGNSGVPKLIDLDGDGLLDMIVGEDSGKLLHYEQTSVHSMSFSLVTTNFNSIDVGQLSSPAFTDIDGDGLIDMIVGRYEGTLYHYEQASVNSLVFNLVTSDFSSINLGNVFARPTFTDLDGDGLLDLIVAKFDGNLIHYEQDSTNSLTFSLITNSFLSINFGSHPSATFTDLDKDGLLDLIIGRSGTTFSYYKQAAINSLTFNLVTNGFNNINLGPNPNSDFTDIDGDGLLDMVCGNSQGTINAFEQLPGSFTNYQGAVGTPSATQTLQVWGGSCLSDNITLTAPTGFEVSKSAGSGFSNSISLTPTDGSVANTIVYVRFNPLTEGSFTGNLEITAANADTVSFALNGCTPPSPPTNTSNTTVCVTESATLTATCASGTVKWYNSSTSYLLSTGSPFITPPLSESRSYSVRCEGCNISSFVDVQVQVIPPFPAPNGVTPKTICPNTSVSLSAICNTGTVKWFDSDGTTLLFTGVPFETPSLNTNTTYKSRCAVGSCLSAIVDVPVTIITSPTDTSNPTICYNSGTLLSASCASGNITWYNSVGTVLQGTGSPFVTPNLSSNTTYKVRCESENVANCVSEFVEVTVTVLPPVAEPTAINMSSTAICSGTNITLSANCTVGNIKWYPQQTGAIPIGTTSPLVQSPSTTTTYYVSCTDAECESARVATNQVVVTTQPTEPIAVSVSSTAICSGSNISLSATCSIGTIMWYNQQTGGAVIGTGTNVSQSPTANITYYASCKNANCESARAATNLIRVGTASTNLNITTDISSGNTLFLVTQIITATNKINSPANTVYKAGKSILLNPGFEAKSGGTLKAYIGGCAD
jgi:cold shock CspA family protein